MRATPFTMRNAFRKRDAQFNRDTRLICTNVSPSLSVDLTRLSVTTCPRATNAYVYTTYIGVANTTRRARSLHGMGFYKGRYCGAVCRPSDRRAEPSR